MNLLTSIRTNLLPTIVASFKNPRINDVSCLVASQYTAAGLGLLTTILTARILGPTDFGKLALVTAYPTLLWSTVNVKSVSITTRYLANLKAHDQVSQVKGISKLGYSMDLLISIIIFLLVIITSKWVAKSFYGIPELSRLMVLFAASFPLTSLVGTSQAILSASYQFRLLALLQLINPVLNLTLVAAFLLSGFGVPAVVLAAALGQAVMGVVMMLAATRVLLQNGLGYWWQGSISSISFLWKELAAFFGWNYLVITFNGFLAQLPLMMLGRLCGPEEAGNYRLAFNLMTVSTYIGAAMGRVAYPALSVRWDAGERQRIKKSLRRWTLRAGLPLSLLLLLSIPLIPVLIPLAYGPHYRHAIWATKIMMVAAAVSALFFWLTNFYYASGQIALWTKVLTINTLLVLGLGWLATRQWGLIGMVVVFTLGSVAFTLTMAMFTKFRETGL